MKKSHFRIPFPYKKQAISWEIPDIIRRFTINNGIFPTQIHILHIFFTSNFYDFSSEWAVRCVQWNTF
jgi:hypothetical protein